MRFLPGLRHLFKRPAPPSQEEIERRLRRLNELVLAYQDVETAADEREMDTVLAQELQWFKRHHLRLTRTPDGHHEVAVRKASIGRR